MFRATLCSSSGQLYQYNIWYNYCVLVAVRWAQSCSKHVEDLNKHSIEEIVHQVGHLPELNEDARSKEYISKKDSSMQVNKE